MILIYSTFCDLKNRVNYLKNCDWIAVPKKGFGEVGLLVEEKLNLRKNDFSVPDFNGIEIKVKRCSSTYPITMFSCTCDGPDIFELRRFVEKFGIRYKDSDLKILFITLSATKYSNWGRYLKMKLDIDRKQKKIYILVANVNGKVIEKRAYWSFSTLEIIMQRKMRYLCLITYDVFYWAGVKYAKVMNDYYLSFNDFSKFVNELERGNIVVNIKVGVDKKEKNIKVHDHGTSFQIFRNSLLDVFEKYHF